MGLRPVSIRNGTTPGSDVLRLEYDGSQYAQFDVTSNGNLVIRAGLMVTGLLSGAAGAAAVGPASGAGTLEVQNTPDVILSLYKTKSVADSIVDECAIAYWGHDAGGTFRKYMSFSTKLADLSLTNGYTITRLNTPYFSGGVWNEQLIIQAFGGKGIMVGYPPDPSPPVAGTIAQFLGRVYVTGDFEVGAIATIPTQTLLNVQGAGNSLLQSSLRNTDAGNAAGQRLRLGNNASANALTIDVYGSGHSTQPNEVLIINQTNAPLILGANGAEVCRMNPAGGIRFPEISDPAAPAANTGLIYMKDNGSGKTQFVARFPSGAVQVIATEP